MDKGHLNKSLMANLLVLTPWDLATLALTLLLAAGSVNAADNLLRQSSVTKSTTTLPSNGVDSEQDKAKEKKAKPDQQAAIKTADSSLVKPASQTKKVQPSTNKAKKNKNDRFTPTEAISEDLAVSFPTDI